MRAREFIVEYRRDITIKNMGDKLFDAFKRMTGFTRIPDSLKRFKAALNDMKKYSTLFTPAEEQEKINEIKDKVIAELVNYFESKDPTQNKQYTQWMIRTFINDPDSVALEDYNRHGYLELYHRGKQLGIITPTSNHIYTSSNDADIGTFKTYRQFEAAVYKYVGQIEQGIGSKDSNDRGDYDEVYRDDTVRVIVPKNQTAACFWGRGTRWCTASTRGANYFESYNKDGPLYILLPTNPSHPGEKFQLHFQSKQFMDENDKEVDAIKLIKRFPNFFTWIKENTDYLDNMVYFADSGVLNGIAKKIGERMLDLAYAIMESAGKSDYDFLDWQKMHAADRGYFTDDDQIDYNKIYNDPDLEDYTKYSLEYRKFMEMAEDLANTDAADLRRGTTLIRSRYKDGIFTSIEDIVPEVYSVLFGEVMDKVRRDIREPLEELLKKLEDRVSIYEITPEQLDRSEYKSGAYKLRFNRNDLVGNRWLVRP